TLDLANPAGFHEKICWLRLNRLTPLHSYCADKVTAPAYVASVAGPGHTVRRFFWTTDPERLSPETIPARRCILKTNNASGGVFPIPDTATADWPTIRRELRELLDANYYWKYRERQYRTIRPAIVVDEYLDQAGLPMGELNFYCLNGVARFALSFPPGAILASQKGVLLGRDGQRLAATRQRRKTAQQDIQIPVWFTEMRALAERLAAPFPLVRVDFLLDHDGYWVSELTFSPSAGYDRFQPETVELEFGALLDHRAEVPDWRPILAAARAQEPAVLAPRI
ncbi:MAG: ATP-grasp fold amidoligase family protein, partial [Paracoccaceae bacterium]